MEMMAILNKFGISASGLIRYAKRKSSPRDFEVFPHISEQSADYIKFKRDLVKEFHIPELGVFMSVPWIPHGIPPTNPMIDHTDDLYNDLYDQVLKKMYKHRVDASVSIKRDSSVGTPFHTNDMSVKEVLFKYIVDTMRRERDPKKLIFKNHFLLGERRQPHINSKTVFTLNGQSLTDRKKNVPVEASDFGYNSRVRLVYGGNPWNMYLALLSQPFRSGLKNYGELFHHDLIGTKGKNRALEYDHVIATDFASFDQSIPIRYVRKHYEFLSEFYGIDLAGYFDTWDVVYPDFDKGGGSINQLILHRTAFPEAEIGNMSGHNLVDLVAKTAAITAIAWCLVKAKIDDKLNVVNNIFDDSNQSYTLLNQGDDCLVGLNGDIEIKRRFEEAMAKFEQFAVTVEDPPKFIGWTYDAGHNVMTATPNSYLLRTFTPEYSWVGKNHKTGMAMKRQFYLDNDPSGRASDIIKTSDEMFKKRFNIDLLDILVDDADSELAGIDFSKLNYDERLFLMDQDYIHYKIDSENVRRELLDRVFFTFDNDDISKILSYSIGFNGNINDLDIGKYFSKFNSVNNSNEVDADDDQDQAIDDMPDISDEGTLLITDPNGREIIKQL